MGSSAHAFLNHERISISPGYFYQDSGGLVSSGFSYSRLFEPDLEDAFGSTIGLSVGGWVFKDLGETLAFVPSLSASGRLLHHPSKMEIGIEGGAGFALVFDEFLTFFGGHLSKRLSIPLLNTTSLGLKYSYIMARVNTHLGAVLFEWEVE